jgi:hypothetical protein
MKFAYRCTKSVFFGTKLALSVAIPCSYRQLLRYWKTPGRPPNRPGRLPYDVVVYRNWIGSFATAHNRKSLNSAYATSQRATDTKTAKEFCGLLRFAIRCGWLRASDIFEILLEQVIERLRRTSRAATSARRRHERETVDKLTCAIHQGFGLATWLLDDDAVDEYLSRSAAALERARKELFQSHPARRACK